jgi:hypothetical protein
MSFMPSPGSLVRLDDGAVAVVTKVTPGGGDDRVQRLGSTDEERITAWDIHEVLHETD